MTKKEYSVPQTVVYALEDEPLMGASAADTMTISVDSEAENALETVSALARIDMLFGE